MKIVMHYERLYPDIALLYDICDVNQTATKIVFFSILIHGSCENSRKSARIEWPHVWRLHTLDRQKPRTDKPDKPRTDKPKTDTTNPGHETPCTVLTSLPNLT
jgi:hypothetical protein